MTMQLDLLDLGHPEMPTLDLSRCHSRPISHLTAARMVERFHYAHRVPSIVAAVGMYVDDVLAGVATYGVPPNRNVLACCGEERIPQALELNRLFIHDWAGRNSESWLIAQSFRWLADKWPGFAILVSYADTAQGHHGMIYRATNWLYTGFSSEGGKEGIRLRDGSVVHAKDLHNRYGDASLALVRQALGREFDAVVGRSPKHRYVQFLGNRRQKRELRAALKWPVLPYPIPPAAAPDQARPVTP
jgi:hypothetical protein